MDHSWVPMDTCTLPTVQQPLRAAEFDALFDETLVAVQRVDAVSTRLELAGPPGLDVRVQDLADRETSCCSFFRFTVSTADRGTRVRLDIAVPPQRAGVLTALTARAEAAARPAPTQAEGSV